MSISGPNSVSGHNDVKEIRQDTLAFNLSWDDEPNQIENCDETFNKFINLDVSTSNCDRHAACGDMEQSFEGGHMIYSEYDFQSWVQKKLKAFVSSWDSALTLDPMSKDKRMIVHKVASQMNLKTRSTGPQDQRKMVITHRFNESRKPLIDHKQIRLNAKQLPTLDKFIAYNFNSKTLIEYFNKGFAVSRRDTSVCAFLPSMLIPPSVDVSSHSKIQLFRMSLPACKMRRHIMDVIRENRVTIIVGGTGCGKTTQVPQFILEDAALKRQRIRIFCTQPRRLSAVAVAMRVAAERCEAIGGTVGYHIRLEQKTSKSTVLTYCTSGVLLRSLANEKAFDNISHIILDEIHEREQNTDFILIALKKAVKEKKDLKIILMSATLGENQKLFSEYFDIGSTGFINISSSLFDVEVLHLPEVLAITNYQPKSSFIGCEYFGRSPRSLNDINNSFPAVDFFQIDSVGYDPNECFPQVDAFSGGNVNGVHGLSACEGWQKQNAQFECSQSKQMMMQFDSRPQVDKVSNGINNHSRPCFDHSTVFLNDTITRSHLSQQSHFYGPAVRKQNDVRVSTIVPYANGQWNDVGRQGNDFRHGVGSSNRHFALESVLNHHFIEGTSQNCYQNRGGYYVAEIPHRPESFEPICIQMLRNTRLDTLRLVDNYFNNGGEQWVDGIDVDLTVSVINYCIDSPIDGAILVFLPSYDDIMAVSERLNCLKGHKRTLIVFPLHSQIGNQDQLKVFDHLDSCYRKVILSTNIAEASLTIEDVVFVIDSGKVKEKVYDHSSRVSELKVVWIAKSNAVQRTGRAGRCQNGFCFRLYTQENYDAMRTTQEAEMRRLAIHEVCLHAKMHSPQGVNIQQFLSLAPEPPMCCSVEKSLEFLEMLGALIKPTTDDIGTDHYLNAGFDSVMSDLGFHVARLPLDPQLARLLLFGVALKCLDPVITLVAVLSHRDPFTLPSNTDNRHASTAARDYFADKYCSDHLTLMRAYYLYESSNNRHVFSRNHCLSVSSMRMITGIRKQLFFELKRLKLLPESCVSILDSNLNKYSRCWPLIQCAIVAGSYPEIGVTRGNCNLRKVQTSNGVAQVRTNSAVKRSTISQIPELEVHFLAYRDLALIGGQLNLRTVSVVPVLSVFLFGGPIRLPMDIVKNFGLDKFVDASEVDDDAATVTSLEHSTLKLDWLSFEGAEEYIRLLLKFRVMVMSYILDVMKDARCLESLANDDLLSTVEFIVQEEYTSHSLPHCDLSFVSPVSSDIREVWDVSYQVDNAYSNEKELFDNYNHVNRTDRCGNIRQSNSRDLIDEYSLDGSGSRKVDCSFMRNDHSTSTRSWNVPKKIANKRSEGWFYRGKSNKEYGKPNQSSHYAFGEVKRNRNSEKSRIPRQPWRQKQCSQAGSAPNAFFSSSCSVPPRSFRDDQLRAGSFRSRGSTSRGGTIICRRTSNDHRTNGGSKWQKFLSGNESDIPERGVRYNLNENFGES